MSSVMYNMNQRGPVLNADYGNFIIIHYRESYFPPHKQDVVNCH